LRSSVLFNGTNITHMTISVSRGLHILYIMFMITALIMNTTFARFYMRVDILLTFMIAWFHTEKYICALKSMLTRPPFIKMPDPGQHCERSYIWLSVVSSMPLSTMFLFDFRTVLTIWYFNILFHSYFVDKLLVVYVCVGQRSAL
jgi:hypothetical protein